MKKRWVWLLALWAAFSAAAVRADELHMGDKMDFAFTSVTGQQVSMKALAGKIVIVEMWVSSVQQCQEQVPHMVQLNQEESPKGVQLIGICMDNDKAALLKYLDSKKITWPQCFDHDLGKNSLAQLWKITNIPRAFLVAPDGKILWIGHPGEMDQPLADALKNFPPVLVDPELVKAQNKLLDQVEAAMADKNTSKAVKLLATVKPEACKDATFAARFQAIQQKLQDAAKQALADIDPLIEKKQYVEASQKLEDLCKAFFGTPIGKDIKAKLDNLLKNPDAKVAIEVAKTEAAATAALTAAQKLVDAKNDLDAYRAMKRIVAQFPNTPQAATAATAVANYEKVPDFVLRANSDQDTTKARAMLGLADSFRQSGDTDKAKAKYQQVIDQYKGTPEAAQAQKALNEIGN